MTTTAAPLPQEGGRYYRKGDGSLAAMPEPKASKGAEAAPSKTPSKEA